MISRRITIIKSVKPKLGDVNSELQWFGRSLGLFNLRDKDKSCFRIFIILLKAAKQQTLLSSDEIALALNLSRGTVVYHLNRLMDAGLVIAHRNKYILRSDDLVGVIAKVKQDIDEMYDTISDVAKEIDGRLGL